MNQTNKAVLVKTLGDFKSIGAKNLFAEEMLNRAQEIGLNPGDSEKTSWAENYDALSILFSKSNLPDDVVVAFEYRAPIGGRVDCMLFGKGKDDKNNVVLFELKGWKDAKLSYNNSLIETFTGGRLQDVEHPSVQAGNYSQQFTDYIELLNSEEYRLTGLAYCYNYTKSDENDALFHSNFETARNSCFLYTNEDKDKLAHLLSSLLNKGEGSNIYDDISSWHISPTRKLIESAADIIIDQDNFRLFGEQSVAFKKFEKILKDSLEKNEKSVIVIKGGPGTGKTVIALKMLSFAAKLGKTPMFATRSTALRDQLQNALKKAGANNLISDIYNIRPSRYYESELDILLVDEAHRVAEKHNADKTGRLEVVVEHEGVGNPYCPLSQISSLIYCSKVTVFFIDDHQAVKSSEIGMSDKIIEKAKNYKEEIEHDIVLFKEQQKKKKEIFDKITRELEAIDNSLNDITNVSSCERAKISDKLETLKREQNWNNCLQNIKVKYKKEINISTLELKTQVRCAGGDKFIAWLDDVLYKNTNSISYLYENDFNLKFFDNPNDLYTHIKRLNDPTKNITARLCAGWCWKWKQETTEPNGDLLHEIQIPEYNFSIPWETLKSGRKATGDFKEQYAPDTNSWASHPMGINQVGCIHTAQGFEFDYVGVIIGPDLVYDEKNDCLKCIPEENKEGEIPKRNPQISNILIRNIYRVLMSRGKYGCYIYCCDPKVADYFKRFIITQ